jgi:hypothetical protein
MPSMFACTGDDEGGNVVPEGDHHHYIVNSLLVPSTSTQANEFGLDLDGKGSKHDNALGGVLSTLKGLGFEVQPTIDAAVAEGSIILLADFQTKDFAKTSKAGVQVFLGDSSMVTPAACNASEMYNPATKTGCGRHLVPGMGNFAISASSPTNAALGGPIAGGTFSGGPGNLALQIALGGTEAIELNLIGARAKGSMLTADGLGSMILAGAMSKTDIDTKVIPAIHKQLLPIIAEDCPTPTVAGCGCASDSTGKTILGFLDTKKADGSAGQDCTVTEDEIATNPTVSSFLSPDVEIDGVKALSLGIKATAVKANFTVAGQL